MSILDLRTDRERTLFTACLVISILFLALLVLGTLGIGILYVAAAAGFVLMTKALTLAAIKGNGVRITETQFPDLHGRLRKAAKKLEIDRIPSAYLLNHRGILGALATRFLNRDFLILYTELLESCEEEDGSIDFIIGHELGHLALGHLKWSDLLLPSRIVPLLYPAYSRECEYSCDRAGTVVAGRPEAAVAGLAVLAAGKRYGKRLDVDAYLQQRMETGGFWMSVVELGMSHPYLPKRVGAILGDTKPDVVVGEVSRNPFAYVCAPLLGGGTAGLGVMAVLLCVGIATAVAVPAFIGQNASSLEQSERLMDEHLKRETLSQETAVEKAFVEAEPVIKEEKEKKTKKKRRLGKRRGKKGH